MVKADEIAFENYGLANHGPGPGTNDVSAITGMDVCIRKPLIITCGVDKSLRVWNYLEKTCDLVKFFPEDPYSVALHPSGQYCCVGFSDKLRLLNILMDDIRTYKELAFKGCKECRFSNGGQLFAAVCGNAIHIFSTYTTGMDFDY
jgi:hypothetical protein